MSKKPNEAIKISPKFRTRIISIISDEDYKEGESCTTSEFAKRVGVSVGVISNITAYGIIPSTKSLIKIADYKNKSIKYILGLTDDPYFEKSENPSSFFIRLPQLIKEKNKKISDITNASGITFTRNSIHLWLKRNNLPYIEFLLQLEEYFDVSVDYLLGRTDYKN